MPAKNVEKYSLSRTGLPDFSWHIVPKRPKINQMVIQFTEWPFNIGNGHKI
jgi:hypothetical protein